MGAQEEQSVAWRYSVIHGEIRFPRFPAPGRQLGGLRAHGFCALKGQLQPAGLPEPLGLPFVNADV